MTTMADKVAERLAMVRREEQSRAEQDARSMQARAERLSLLERLGEDIHRRLIRPRLEELAAPFRAAVEHFRTRHGFQTYVLFKRDQRFPATAKLSMGITWENAALDPRLVSRVEILPAFMSVPENTPLTLDCDSLDEASAAQWIEQRLLTFLDTYLRLATDPNYQRDSFGVDPVCDMQVWVVDARHTAEYAGKRYFFCSEPCRERFLREPALFTQGRVAIPDTNERAAQ